MRSVHGLSSPSSPSAVPLYATVSVVRHRRVSLVHNDRVTLPGGTPHALMNAAVIPDHNF